MPSWNEKPHVIPTINVNLKRCSCGPRTHTGNVHGGHWPECGGEPILIPCPIPRSVRLGKCFCTTGDLRYMPQDSGGDLHICPACPIRVACSISGKTWEESEVDDVEVEDEPPSGVEWPTFDSARICTERWALVKALLGVGSWADAIHPHSASVRIGELRDQRDAVFAALADMARAEEAALAAQQRVDEAFPFARYRRNDADHRAERPSHGRLAAYVEHLIEQVGVL